MNKKAVDKEAKAAKKALAEQQKRMRPGECLKYITTVIDPAIIAHRIGIEIEATLAANGIASSTRTNPTTCTTTFPRTITWQRQQPDDRVMPEDYVLLVWPADELHASVQRNDFVTQMRRVHQRTSSNTGHPPIMLVVCGLTEHLRTQPRSAQSAQRAQIERELTRLQLVVNIGHRFAETAAELATTVLLFAKSVAEAPYKRLAAASVGDQCFYAANDNRDCVTVRGTVGLASLWQHQLCKMPMATLETAEAIIGAYAMPRLLLDAYANGDGGAELLSNIPVRRAGGPLSTVRKIGPELSRRVYQLYTSDDPEQIL